MYAIRKKIATHIYKTWHFISLSLMYLIFPCTNKHSFHNFWWLEDLVFGGCGYCVDDSLFNILKTEEGKVWKKKTHAPKKAREKH